MIYHTSNSRPGLEKRRPASPTAIVHFLLETFLKMEGYGSCCLYSIASYSFLCVQNPGPTVRLIPYSYFFLISYSAMFYLLRICYIHLKLVENPFFSTDGAKWRIV